MGNASVQRGLFLTFRLFSLIRHALRRATFPAGEGDLPAGEGDLPAGEGTETLRAGSVGTNLPPGYRTWRGDVGIAPYAKDKTDRGPLLFLALAFFGIVWYNVQK